MNLLVQAGDNQFDYLGSNSAKTKRQTLRPQQQHGAHYLGRQKLANSEGMGKN